MIAPLRRAHARAWLAVAAMAPVVLAAALLARPSTPVVPGLPPELARFVGGPASPRSTPSFTSDDAWAPLPLRMRLFGAPRGSRAIELAPRAPLRAPDLLLYASPAPAEARPAPGDPLPAGAVLVGHVAGTRTQQMGGVPAGFPTLVLYSLARGEVVGSAAIPFEEPEE